MVASVSRPRPEDFLDIEPLASSLEAIETPAPVVDLDVVERNVARLQDWCDRLRMANRPHIKTHKSVGLARYQIAAGASGVTVQKLGEAEVMADSGIADLLLTYNIVGASKLERLAALVRRTAIKTVADNAFFSKASPTRLDAAGVRSACLSNVIRAAGATASKARRRRSKWRRRSRDAGAQFAGLMTYPKAGTRAAAGEFLASAKHLCEAAALPSER